MQIAEAVYDGALFKRLARLADAFDLRQPEWLNRERWTAPMVGSGE